MYPLIFRRHFNFRHYSSKINEKMQSWSLTCQIKPQTKERVKRTALLKPRLSLPLRKAANVFELVNYSLYSYIKKRTFGDVFLAYDLEEEVAFLLYFTYSNSFILNVTVSKRENRYGVTVT